MEIIKLIGAKELSESSFSLPVSWEQIIPAIEKAVMLRSDETIDGLIISKDSIEVKVSRKKGRKTSATELFTSANGGE